MTMRGFDISSWQHPDDKPIDFSRARNEGFGFVMIKATQGDRYKNPHLAEDSLEAHRAGLLVGCYHYAVPGVDDAVLQAKFAAAAVVGLPLSLGVALDLEETGSLAMHELSTWAETWLKTMNEAGHNAPFYTNENYLSQMPSAPWGHKLWYASKDLPEFRQGLHIWMHQDTASGTVPGIHGHVDLDTFYGVRGVNPPPKAPPHAAAHAAEVVTPTTGTETTGEVAGNVSGHGDGSGTDSLSQPEPASSTVDAAGSDKVE